MAVEKNTTTRNYSIDVLRILACLAVVMAHVVSSPLDRIDPGSFDYNLCLFLKGVRRWGVPVFLMITGFFMLDPAKEVPMRKLFSKNILRILTALIFWSGVYALVLHKPFYPLGSQEAHFWYLGMIIGVYLAVPILRYITANSTLLKYFVLVWFCVMVYNYVGRFVTLPFDMDDVLFVKYAGYCVLGYYIKTLAVDSFEDNAKKKKIRRGVYWLGLIALLVTSIGGVISQNGHSVLFNYGAPNMIICSAAILLFAASHPLKLQGKKSAWLLTCSECTFGIYLVHMLVVIEIYSRIRRFIPNIPLNMFVTIVVAFCVSYVIAFLLKKVPILKKYVV